MVQVLFKIHFYFHFKFMESLLDIYSVQYYTVDVKLTFHFIYEVTL